MKKRSNAPIFWLLFGAGGVLAALTGVALVLITGVLVPLGLVLPQDYMAYPRVLAFAQNWFFKAFLFAVIALFAWHAVHRIYHSLHDLGIHNNSGTWMLCYGSAMAITALGAIALLGIGF